MKREELESSIAELVEKYLTDNPGEEVNAEIIGINKNDKKLIEVSFFE